MVMTRSSLLLPVAGVLVRSHSLATPGLLLRNGMFEPGTDHMIHIAYFVDIGTGLCSDLMPLAGSLRQKDLPTYELLLPGRAFQTIIENNRVAVVYQVLLSGTTVLMDTAVRRNDMSSFRTEF